jgi:hypothetical protein
VVVLLVGVAAIARPVWHDLDPAPARMEAACAAWLAGEPLDPWGRPWYVAVRSEFADRDATVAATARQTFASSGPDGVQAPWHAVLGSAGPPGDDFVVGSLYQDGRRVARAPAEVRRYQRAPWLVAGLAGVLLVTRWLSGVVRRVRGARRFAQAAALGLAPWAYTCFAIGLVRGVEPFANIPVFDPTLAMVGSIFALFFSLVFVHRELGDVPAAPAEAEPPKG